MKKYSPGDKVWIVAITNHKYVRYAVKPCQIRLIKHWMWVGGERVLYGVDGDADAERYDDDLFDTEVMATEKAEQENGRARSYRLELRREKRRKGKRQKPLFVYDSRGWVNMIRRRKYKNQKEKP